MSVEVVSQNQVAALTGGRQPMLPAEYESACRQLAKCETLNESKYWSDKADALAAWAKIFHDDEARLTAIRLKARALRRMWQLAVKLRPKLRRGRAVLGPKSLLKEHGLNDSQVNKTAVFGRMPARQFSSHMALRNPSSPSEVYTRETSANPEWTRLSRALSAARTEIRKYDPIVFAHALSGTKTEAQTAARLAVELVEWLDRFEQALKPL